MAIGRLHAVALDTERDAGVTEKEVRKKGDERDPDQEFRCERREKELSNLLIQGHKDILGSRLFKCTV